MTATRLVVLSCDAPGCEAEATEGEWFTTVHAALEDAAQRGWVRRVSARRLIDLCPNHAGDARGALVNPGSKGVQLMPRELRVLLMTYLPDRPRMTIIPRNRHEQYSSAASSDHYEIVADYPGRPKLLLTDLEKALADYPGVYLTTQVVHGQGAVNPAWPVRYRNPADLRSQVCALWRPVNPPPQAESPAPRTTRRD